MPDLKIRLFAVLKERAGRDVLTVDAPDGVTVKGLKQLIRSTCPEIGTYLEATRVAINLEFASEEATLAPTDDIALIPPVSGG